MEDEVLHRLLVIGLCTYKRPLFLRHCLESIANAEKPVGVPWKLVVADNDPEGSAETVIRQFERDFGIAVEYAIETGRGIPFARNNVLRRALELGATELAFLDDDETAAPRWLAGLWSHYTDSGSDVVRGYVDTSYPADTPRWILKGGFYRRRNHPTGTKFESAITGNILFNFDKLVRQHKLWFDESLGQRGGSDSDYFRRAHALGAVISWSADAVVYETHETERFALSYLLKRKFRTRNAAAYFKGLGARKRAVLLVRSLFKILSGVLFLPLSPFFGSHIAVKTLCRIVEGAGRLLGLFNIYIGWNEYHGK